MTRHLVVALVCAASIRGQTTAAAFPNEPLRYQLPKPVEARLGNGLSVIVLEDHRLPTVSVELVISGAGGLFDPADRPGLAVTTAAMMLEGTTTMSSRQIVEGMDDLGASLSFASGYGISEVTMQASGLSDNLDRWLALAFDVLLNANFPDTEFQKLKQRHLAGLGQQRSQPGFLAAEMFRKAVFGAHPASIATATPASVSAMSDAEVKSWRDTRYAPQNAILAISGDVNAKQLIPKLSAWTAGWKKSDATVSMPPSPTVPAKRHVYLVDRPDSTQTNLILGNLAIARNDADFPAFAVLNQILGGSAASRLFTKVPGANSSFQPSDFVGPWQAAAEVSTPATDGAMGEFLKEFARLRDEKVSTAELQDAERFLVSQFALSLEQPVQLLNYQITSRRFGLSNDYWTTYASRISAVTAEDVQRVARKYMALENLQVVAVGDAARIKGVMEKYGPVSVYSSDGTPAAK